jgi:hypothetical protein
MESNLFISGSQMLTFLDNEHIRFTSYKKSDDPGQINREYLTLIVANGHTESTPYQEKATGAGPTMTVTPNEVMHISDRGGSLKLVERYYGHSWSQIPANLCIY